MSDEAKYEDTGNWEADYSTEWRPHCKGFVMITNDLKEVAMIPPDEADRLASELKRAARLAREDMKELPKEDGS